MIFDWFDPGYSSTLLNLAVDMIGVSNGAYTLVDAKTRHALQRDASARQHFVRCNFCRRSVANVPKRKGRRTMFSDELITALTTHIITCGIVALRDVMCRWSIGVATNQENQAVQRWLVDPARRFPSVLIDRMLPILPRPPQSLEARCLETGLALWARGEPVDWTTLEPLG